MTTNKKAALTQSRLKELLNYNSETGDFTWKVGGHCRMLGSVAGSRHNCGYRKIGIDGGVHLAHRLAFLYMTGEFPSAQCDHKDHNRSNNRWDNLRAVSNQENSRNTSLQKNNTSGIAGVCAHKTRGKILAQIYVCGRKIFLGYFTNETDAIAARKSAEKKHGFHENHGAIANAQHNLNAESEKLAAGNI